MTDGTPGGPPLFRQTVRDEWIDYNGHLSEAYYVLVFGFATDALMDAAGLDAAYRERTGCSLYTVEAHVRYLHEVARHSELTVRTTVLGVDGKKLRLLHEMFAGEPSGEPVATEELFTLHIDQAAGRSAPLPATARAHLTALVAPAPEWAGRGIREV
ncbi:thioesterase family protein [Streptomyces libani]|uniref:4-hydroxybenzoyl-CoA thioesterase n=2 Tax=Streptomyces nigrescens TaxID=1920 RepID=A0A640TAR3_STRNI|nr:MULTISPECIES: thioesterase family protein [Streptomyces]MCX5447549.1 thioesterase family protein [Streptomyces libani]MCX5447674.1 thioesterase family protein [Streptomyces libani]WAT95589.1 thioesterase family protein [Streptomyces libani subsp. libani]WAU03213.1 thioesterase family protein [Streptomyces nigrescens]WDT58790.1 thioesterase family protein [Streptomyces sp. G7(2002)]